MSTSLSTMIRLRGIQNKIRQMIEALDDNTFRLLIHPDLSPIGWQFGHCLFTENYWLHEVIQGNNKLSKKPGKLYAPGNCPVEKLGKKLPAASKLIQESIRQNDNNDLLLMEMTPPLSEHPLFKDEYIQNYLIQHYAQHYEIMQIIMNQIGINAKNYNFTPETPLIAQTLRRHTEQIPGGEYTIGGSLPFSCDNELPLHSVKLDSYNIATFPVTNAEYLGFIEDKGYETREHWSDEAWLWISQNQIRQPEHWRQNRNNDWYGLNQYGPFELKSEDYVYGISQFEAAAFARWASARLPHEYEWETCAKLERLKHSGIIWEWCSNIFQPYDNFKAFPNNESETGFNGRYYILKGASEFTRPEMRRASYRNFTLPDTRYKFSGLRLIF